jgi:hypothetical protein
MEMHSDLPDDFDHIEDDKARAREVATNQPLRRKLGASNELVSELGGSSFWRTIGSAILRNAPSYH